MVAGTADDGRCMAELAGLVAPQEASSLAYRRLGLVLGLRDLRKTARGASSPAKPALHMPELVACQLCPPDAIYLKLLWCAVDTARRIGRGAGGPAALAIAPPADSPESVR